MRTLVLRSLVFNSNYKLWTSDFETEDCKTCVKYPLCGARQCMHKKVNYPDERPDCDAKLGDVKEEIEDLIKSGYLDKRHISD